MKKLYYLFTIYFLLQLNGFAQSGWNLIYSFEQQINSIAFKDSLIGLASGAAYAKIYKTIDGGESWNTVNIAELNSVISNIIFYNNDMCFGVGKDGTVIKSTDSGNTWSIGSVGDQDELRTIYASPGGKLFICQRSGNYIYKSTDQGVSWSKIFSNSTGYMYDFGFINETIGYLVGDSMVKTNDGGDNWFPISNIVPLGRNLGIKFVDESAGYILAYNYSGGKVAKTTDGGNNWFVVYDSNYGPILWDLTTLGHDTIWAVGQNRIVKSTNAGSSWVQQLYTPTDILYKTVSVNSLTCFALGSIGTLYKTVDGGLSPSSLVYPNNYSTNLPLTISLSWSSLTSGNPFEVVVAKDSAFNSLVIDTLINATLYELTNLGLNSLYFWRVREKFGDLYSPWSEVWNFKTTAGAPSLTSPANNSIDVPLMTTFLWNDVTLNADSYQLQLSTEPNFTNVFFNDSTISSNTFELIGLLDSVLYYWRVKAKINNTNGDWSYTWHFRTLAKTARLLSPPNNSTISPMNITLQWSPTSQTIDYRLQVSTDSMFLTNVIDQDNIIGLTTIINLNYATKYFWRVGAKNQDGNTYWSDYLQFHTRPMPTTSFPLDIGNKWYYKAGSTRDVYYYGVEKEITDTLSNGFKEVTSKYFYRDSISVDKEYWAYIDGKYYINNYNTVYYNDYLTQDTCSSTGIVEQCWFLVPYQLLGILDTSQVYSYWWRYHGADADEITIFPEIGIAKVWHYSYITSATRDSIYLIGMYRNGEVLGDTIISPPPIFEGDDWVVLQSGTTNDLNSVFFTDRYTGTVVGNNGTILRTTNGGKNWITQASRLKSKLNSVFFIDANNGWIVADDDTMLFTNDGGSSWVSQETGNIHYLYDISFIDLYTGIAVGSSGWMIYTSNGGTTWNSQHIGSYYDLLGGIDFRNLDNATAVSWNGSIYNTSNSGITWNQQSVVTSTRLNDILYFDQNNGIIVGSAGKILRTTDGGENWFTQSSGTDKFLNAVALTDLRNGTVVGPRGIILRTSNGGSEWITQLSGTFNDLNDVTFTDAKNGWIVGSGGLILHTTSSTEIISNPISPTNNSTEVILPVKFSWSSVPNILSYELQISTNSSFSDSLIDYPGLTDTSFTVNSLNYASQYFWRVKTISSLGYEYWSQVLKFNTIESPIEFNLSQNYPNPFNPGTTINYSIANKQLVKIIIFDLLGREVATLVNEEKSKGRYSVEFNGSSLASGIYFYQLQAGDYVETKKMILLR